MAIKNYTTKVDVYTSIGEIQGALARHGATKIMIDYDNGKPQAIAFGIDTPAGPRGFRLPIRDARLFAGAGFVTAYCGDMRTMPGLPAPATARRRPTIRGRCAWPGQPVACQGG